MLSAEETKELLGKPNTATKEAEQVRDACYHLAAIIYDAWQEDEARRLENGQGTGAKQSNLPDTLH